MHKRRRVITKDKDDTPLNQFLSRRLLPDLAPLVLAYMGCTGRQVGEYGPLKWKPENIVHVHDCLVVGVNPICSDEETNDIRRVQMERLLVVPTNGDSPWYIGEADFHSDLTASGNSVLFVSRQGTVVIVDLARRKMTSWTRIGNPLLLHLTADSKGMLVFDELDGSFYRQEDGDLVSTSKIQHLNAWTKTILYQSDKLLCFSYFRRQCACVDIWSGATKWQFEPPIPPSVVLLFYDELYMAHDNKLVVCSVRGELLREWELSKDKTILSLACNDEFVFVGCDDKMVLVLE